MPAHLRTAPRPTRGFTLVELLVVIAIVAVLISLLMPSLGQARDTAKMVSCRAKQRQIGIAMGNYLNDFKLTFPYLNPARADTWPLSWSAAYCWPWQMAIRTYLGNYSNGGNHTVRVLLCDSNPWPVYYVNAQSDPVTSYGMNASTFPSNWNDQSGISGLTDPTHFIKNLKESNLKVPSSILMMGEVPNSSAASNPWAYNMSASFTEYVPFTSAPYWLPTISGGYWLSEEYACRVSGGNPTARVNHFLAWNALMADGHVQLDSKTWLLKNTAGTLGKMYWFNRN